MHCTTFTVVLSWVVITLADAGSHMHKGCDSTQHCSRSESAGHVSPTSDPAEQMIQGIRSALAAADDDLADPEDYPAHYSPSHDEEFDFIVVGAGSAGSVVASRLSEENGWRVLLLEAGSDPTKTTEIPAFFPLLQKSELDWQYQTEPEEYNCLGMKGKKCNWPRGRVLGGSSTINCMFHNRGNKNDYDGWAADGNTGWGFEDVLPYFKKGEDVRAEEVLITPEFEKYHGKEGYLKVETFPFDTIKPLVDSFAEGLEELGYGRNPDSNGESQHGFVTMQGSLDEGRRSSTAKAFLSPAKGRDNLKVSKYSTVTKILINHAKTAYGVEFIGADGNNTSVRAKKEVILSAGAVGSPKLLMLSGVGPRKHLEELKINVVADLPVGENLQDHPLMYGMIVNVNFTKQRQSLENNMVNFLLKRNSPFSGLGLVTKPIFISTIDQKDYPDIELFLLDFDKNTPNMKNWLNLINLEDDIIDQYLQYNVDSYSLLVSGSLLRPFSRGRIQLKSTNPLEHPNIISGYLTDHRDVDTFLRTYEFVYKLLQTEGVKRLDPKPHEVKIPGCSHLEFASKEYRECSIRHTTTTSYHPCCTCKMGPENSEDSVVDPQLRVKGVRGLRVIDASVMPRLVSGHTNAPVVMIAEKGSDFIKEAWSQHKET